MLPVLMTLFAAVPVVEPSDKPILDAFLRHVDASEPYGAVERLREFAEQPEDIVWQGSKYVRMPLIAYRLTGEADYFRAFAERLGNLCSLLTADGNGYLGWYGLPYDLFRDPEAPDTRTDVILTDFVVAGIIAEFAQVASQPELADEFGADAARYLDIARNHLVAKWDARGRYRELPDGTAVYITNAKLGPLKASLTQPHNKHAKTVRAYLHLYDATDDASYLDRAIRLGMRFKRCLTLADDRYTWNYWDPSGDWDIRPDDPSRWKHWIGAEHRGGYYSLSLSQAVLLYERGVVFDAQDIARFVKTQVEVCWNGDMDNPAWARVDGQPMEDAYLSAELSPFDRRVYELAFGARARQGRLERLDSLWHGGVVAGDWLEMKYVVIPKWRGGAPAEPVAGARYEPFEVVESGYQPPQSPPVWK